MADYDNIPSIAVIYEGLLETFTNLTDKSEYYGRVVFITGNAGSANAEDKRQAIWVSQDDGSNAHFLNMSDTDTIASTLSYVKGIVVGDTTYPTIEGGSYLNLVGADGIEITVVPLTGTVTFSGKALSDAIAAAQAAAKAADDKAAGVSNTVNGLIGNISTDRGKSIRTIAEEEAAEVESALLGKESNETDTDTIRGVNNVVTATNRVLFGKPLPLTTDKIKASALPDVIVGQLKFGGTIGNKNKTIENQQLQIKPSADLYGFFDNISTQPFDFTPTTANAKDYKGWYFIVAKPAVEGSIGNFELEVTVDLTKVKEVYEIGDWLLSTGIEWVKIDNTDAVVRVAGMQGDITTKSLVDTLSTEDAKTNRDPLAKKSDIKVDSVSAIAKLDGSTTKSYFSAGVGTTDKDISITADVKSMSNIAENTSANGFADARDVYDFIKARLSIKVVK